MNFIFAILISSCFREWKEKVNLEDITEEDAISYNRKDTFIFDKKKSGLGLTGNEIVMVPNIVLIVRIIHFDFIFCFVNALLNILLVLPSDNSYSGSFREAYHVDFSSKGFGFYLRKSQNYIFAGQSFWSAFWWNWNQLRPNGICS